jgi:hypothetical protein
MMQVVGSTLYLHMKDPALNRGPFANYANTEATVVIPQQMQLEVRGDSYQKLDLYPGEMAHNWSIHHNGEMHINLDKDSDVKLTAMGGYQLNEAQVEWDTFEKISNDNQEERYKGTLQLGDGTYPLNVFNSSHVNVHLLDKP